MDSPTGSASAPTHRPHAGLSATRQFDPDNHPVGEHVATHGRYDNEVDEFWDASEEIDDAKEYIHAKESKGKAVDCTTPAVKSKRVRFRNTLEVDDLKIKTKPGKGSVIEYQVSTEDIDGQMRTLPRQELSKTLLHVWDMVNSAGSLLEAYTTALIPQNMVLSAGVILSTASMEIRHLVSGEDGSDSGSQGDVPSRYTNLNRGDDEDYWRDQPYLDEELSDGDYTDGGYSNGQYSDQQSQNDGHEGAEDQLHPRLSPVSNKDPKVQYHPVAREYSTTRYSLVTHQPNEEPQLNKEVQPDTATASNSHDSTETAGFGIVEFQLEECNVTRLPGGVLASSYNPAHTLGSIHAFYDDPVAVPVNRQPENAATPPIETLVMDAKGQQKLAFAVVIHSPHMQRILEEITQFSMGSLHFFKAPFKIIVLHWKPLLNELETLDQTIATMKVVIENLGQNDVDLTDSPTTGLAASTEPSQTREARVETEAAVEEDDQQTKDTMDSESVASDDTLIDRLNEQYMLLRDYQEQHLHLQTMMDFFRGEIGPAIEVREGLDNQTLDKISFQHLWQLYQIGDVLIYNHDSQQVACQVFAVTGGVRGSHLAASLKTEDVLVPHETLATHQEESRPRDRGIPLYPSSMASYSPSPYHGLATNDDDIAVTEEDYAPLIVDCFIMDFNGTYVGPCQIMLQFPYFPGEKLIETLDAYPLRFQKGAYDIVARLEERGKQLINSVGHRTYEGFTLSGPDDIRGQIYVDFATGYKHIGWPRTRPEFGRLVRHWMPGLTDERLSNQSKLLVSDESTLFHLSERFIHQLKKGLWQFFKPESGLLSNECFLLMSYVALGFAFQMRRWYYLDVEQIGNIDKSESARASGWEDLVIPLAYREMLVALVESHAAGSRNSLSRRKRPALVNQIDLVRGKGNGLIILLHGPPGSGKTSTAETIAAYTQRPLYPITCGDIGTTAEEIEFNLQKHFDLANQWGCVLLLDEADVFLTKRDWQDINRNSLVSVWLRILEYYSGILFITTNRIGVIDEAFKSRIHVCLRYPSLDLAGTRLIWEKLLSKIERQNHEEPVKIVFERDAVLGFAEKHYHMHAETKSTWNGRQIRNVIQTAISLGQHERLRKLRKRGMTEEEAERSGKQKYMQVELSKQNLSKIAATATDFEQYMVDVRGSDINLAKNESVRNDDFYKGDGLAIVIVVVPKS